METLIATLFQSRDFAHFKHLQSKSYAEHMALKEYYEGVIDMIDDLAELHMKTGDIINCPSTIEIPKVNAVDYFDKLSAMLASMTKDAALREDLKNILVDILSIVNKLLYKIKILK